MSQKRTSDKSEELRRELVAFFQDYESIIVSADLRQKVMRLVPAYENLRELGISLVPQGLQMSARERILSYLKKYPLTVINGTELMVVAGISEWARRVRELRVQFGWKILSGLTMREMIESDELTIKGVGSKMLAPDDYILISSDQDKESAHRWNVANEIRKSSASVRDRLLLFLQKNVGKSVTGEELRYVARNSTEWARRIRELRTEHGWPVVTKNTGRPDLGVGVYLLQQSRQSPPHDRIIPDPVRRSVLKRDGYKCKNCQWHPDDWNSSDPRHLELHHCKPHAEGGGNHADNLRTVCTVCHDEIHRPGSKIEVCK